MAISLAGGLKKHKNSQDAEPDVVVRVVVPVVVHVCEPTVLTVAHDEPSVVTIGFYSFRVLFALVHPDH